MMKFLNSKISQETLPDNLTFYTNDSLPERVIQFGEGNFMRGFVDWMIHELNKQGHFNGKVVVVQPRSQDKIPLFNKQDGLFTLILRGVENGHVIERKEIISSISRGLKVTDEWAELMNLVTSEKIRFIFSNTTEAGLTYKKEPFLQDTPPNSFPGKLTALLYHRFSFYGGSRDTGLVILPCELVEDNGNVLKELVLKIANDWQLPMEFKEWIKEDNYFCNTLVDRIVTGYPKDEIEQYEKTLGYKDELLTVGEPYHLFAIDAPEHVQQELPFDKVGLNVKWGKITPFRDVKVRLLNGPHTLMSAVCYLAGANTVQEVMEDKVLRQYIENGMFNEIYPTVAIEEREKEQFAHSVIERFLNPYNKHYLKDIALSSVYKFNTRLIPSLKDYVNEKNTLPLSITFALAGLIVYNRPVNILCNDTDLVGSREGEAYAIRDNEKVLKAFNNAWTIFDETKTNESASRLVTDILTNKEIWGENLSVIPSLSVTVSNYVVNILENGMRDCVEKLVNNVAPINN
ncbi:MAG: tagaturonate reductase [Bacillaceae bacterium]|nr:tagaturonate reductase [Bacillaceae bacterium]